MVYNFDKKIDREKTHSVKYDLRKVVFGTEDVIPMWVADMDLETPEFVRNAIKERAEHQVYGYSFKAKTYNTSIINWLKHYHQWNVKAQEITFSPGVVPGIALSVLAFTQPKDKIMVQTPVYFPFFTTISGNGRQVVNNELINKGGHYSMDFQTLKSQIDAQTSMIIICNPHNPVGRAWKKEELEELVEICEKNDILIISDEIHSDLVFAPHKHIPLASISEKAKARCITFMAPSKTFNMAGLSSSFAVIQNPQLLKTYNAFLDTYHLYLGNIFGSVATEAAYTHGHRWMEAMKLYIELNTDYVIDFIDEHLPAISCLKPEASYLLWFDCSKMNMNEDELKQFFIEKARLGLNQGCIFGEGGEGFMRMNVACPKTTVEKAMQQLKQAFKTQ